MCYSDAAVLRANIGFIRRDKRTIQRTWETNSVYESNKFSTHPNIVILARSKTWWLQTQTNCCFSFSQLWVCVFYAATALCRLSVAEGCSSRVPSIIKWRTVFQQTRRAIITLFLPTMKLLWSKLNSRHAEADWALRVLMRPSVSQLYGPQYIFWSEREREKT